LGGAAPPHHLGVRKDDRVSSSSSTSLGRADEVRIRRGAGWLACGLGRASTNAVDGWRSATGRGAPGCSRRGRGRRHLRLEASASIEGPRGVSSVSRGGDGGAARSGRDGPAWNAGASNRAACGNRQASVETERDRPVAGSKAEGAARGNRARTANRAQSSNSFQGRSSWTEVRDGVAAGSAKDASVGHVQRPSRSGEEIGGAASPKSSMVDDANGARSDGEIGKATLAPAGAHARLPSTPW